MLWIYYFEYSCYEYIAYHILLLVIIVLGTSPKKTWHEMACDMNHIIEFQSIKQDIFKMVGDMVKGIRQKPEEKEGIQQII